jgi:hypothetical protein
MGDDCGLTTCDIYRTQIRQLRESGNVDALAEMVETWYSRCGFETSFDGLQITNLEARDDGCLYITTTKGTAVYKPESDRWKLVRADAAPEDRLVYAMSLISEATQVPFGYLCGVRDALSVINKTGVSCLSEKASRLASECNRLSSLIKKRKIAVDSVVVELSADEAEKRMESLGYPEAPCAALSWDDFRTAFRSTPGVYFAWSGGRIVYVGATKKGSHERFQTGHKQCFKTDLFSYIAMPAREVFFAECVYIARYRPERNACVAEAFGVAREGDRGTAKRRCRKALQVGP